MMSDFCSKPQNLVFMNAASKHGLPDLLIRREFPIEPLFTFSHRLDYENPKALAQKNSGRCWLFAGLNVIRRLVAKKYNMEDFELSQAFIFYVDKMEKGNYFLETIIETFEEPLDGQLMQFLLQIPAHDGGLWDMMMAVVEKYGLVPKSVYGESFHSEMSEPLNVMLTRCLRGFAQTLRGQKTKGASRDELQAEKLRMLADIHRFLTLALGEPPTFKTFDWCFRDKDKKHHAFRNLTPLQFAREHVGIEALVGKTVTLTNDPRRPYWQSYTVKYIGNVIGSRPMIYVNLPIEELKKAAIASIKGNRAIWFACDVGKDMSKPLGVLSKQMFDYESVFGALPLQSKADRMRFGDSIMTHAMVLTGVNLVPSDQQAGGSADEIPTHWRLENSWGEECGEKGFFSMTDEWFDEHAYQVVIEHEFLDERIIKVAETEPNVLLPWDFKC